MAYSSSFSSHNWSYDVFPSFSGGDVRKTFMSHFLKELDRKLIIAFKDNEIKKSRSLDPELTKAIKDSRIAVVIFSTNYASSSWCLNELLEIVKCKEECGQVVIPVFYGLDPSHVRKQTGDFGKIFDKTCQNKTEDKIIRWREALTGVANIFGYHSVTWANEAKMVEEIADDVLDKLNLSPSDEFEDFVGIEDHIREMSSLLHLDSKEVKMVGIWGPSGIGKTTIARALFSRLSRRFQNSVFIDKVFISKSMEVHRGANLCDYNMKLHLQRAFLAEVLDKRDIKIDHIGAVGKMLRHRKALIFIDDLDDQDVLEALAGRIQWFGSGSRIIVVTKDKHLLRAHGIDHIYEVSLPSYKLAVEMFCRYAFRKSSPPDGFAKLASEVVLRAGSLPLGLNVLGSSLRGRDVEDWPDMLPRLRNGLDGKIGRTLRVSYNGLNNKKDEAIFRHIACLFNGKEVDHIKMMLADSDLDVHIGLKNLVDKSLVHVREDNVVMHSLLQEMGEEIVHSQSDEPGEREFLIDSKDICHVFENNTGTKKVLGIALNMDTIKTLHVYENAFRRMCNLCFLEFDSQSYYMLGRAGQSHLPENFSYLPSSLKLLCWYGYPMRCMPSKFCPENLVMLKMRISMLEKLWEGVVLLPCLKEINLWGSSNLKVIPDLSKATNLERLYLGLCSSLLELSSSVRDLKKLRVLLMNLCVKVETIPAGIYLNSLVHLDLEGCSRFKTFPEIAEQDLTHTNLKSEKLREVVHKVFLTRKNNFETLDVSS
ncbi:PREDICTED: disease resistance protein RPS6-like isoform X1 [Brassica oleracea var. oleracea]|uniref:disease resistance protein RPS6-like isoform X1 n=1 Tax=Brassica oleracea var. oleracea TaxID=109376 RepID=UPI0006A6ED76|nr:PREDICTED: disease resistance protein RPS6-like isoform X1 [Brassica oleracea var. oleracea]